MVRYISDTVSYWEEVKRYCVFYAGDELILRATTDEEAIAEGATTIAEMEKFYNGIQE
jgi:hypothetical protein